MNLTTGPLTAALLAVQNKQAADAEYANAKERADALDDIDATIQRAINNCRTSPDPASALALIAIAKMLRLLL